MPGDELPKDPNANEVANARLEFLEKLRDVAKTAFARLGIMENAVEALPAGAAAASELQTSNGWVNAPDTWTCKLADHENDAMKEEVGKVVTACTDLLAAIDSEISRIYANGLSTVPKDHKDATWSPW